MTKAVQLTENTDEEKRAREVMTPEDWLLWYRHKQLERRREIKRLINQKLDEYFAEEDARV